MKIHELPIDERPREKAYKIGLNNISNSELLAIIIGSGIKNKSALEIATSLMSCYQNLDALFNASLSSLENENGLSKILSLKLAAVFELAKRFDQNVSSQSIKNSYDLYNKFSYLNHENSEKCILIMMNNIGKIIKIKELSNYNDANVSLSLRNIIVELFQNGTTKYALIHNHPDGNKYPSQNDIISTRVINKACKNLGLKFYDHLIIFAGGYYSFKEKKIFEANY